MTIARHLDPRRSIRARIALSFGGAALIFALGGGLLAGARQAAELQDQIGSSFRELAFLSGSDLARSIDERQDDLVFAATLAPFRDAQPTEAGRERQREHLQNLQRWHPEFVWLGFADTSGNVLSATGRLLEGLEVSSRPWFVQGAVKTYFGDLHEAMMLAPLLPKGEAHRLIDVAAPVRANDGSLRGVIGAHLSESWVRSRLVALKRGAPSLQGVEILLLGADGRVLVSTELTKASGAVVAGPWGGGGGHGLVEMEGRQYLAGYHPVAAHGDFSGFGWVVVAREDPALALGPAARARNTAVLLGIALGALFTALGWLIAGRIVRPLERMTLAAERQQAGDETALPAGARTDEIGTLSTAMQALVAGLKHDEAVIRARENELARIVETMVEGVALFDTEGRITMVNAAAERILGAQRADIVGLHYDKVPWRRVMPDGGELAGDIHPFARMRAGVESIEGIEFDIVTPRGRVTTIQLSAAALRGADGAFAGMVTTFADVTERRQAEAEKRRAQERLDRALGVSKVALFEVEVAAGNVYLGESWSVMRGGPATPTRTTIPALLELTHPDDRPQLWQLAMDTVRGAADSYETEHRVRTLTGDWIWIISRAQVVERDVNGRAARIAGTNVDVTERKRAEQRIHHLNTRDALTDLSNRALFADRLEQAVADAARSGRRFALLAAGLDRFTAINDSLGHDFGDEVLKTAASRIAASAGAEDVVARPGGDEFLVLLPRVDSPAQADRMAEAMREAVAAPMGLAGRESVVTMSVGVAMFPADGDNAGLLLRNAGIALNFAKVEGGDRAHFFAAHMNAAAKARFETEGQLRLALERGEFVLHYQPQVDLASGAVVGWEALVRWRHPERGLVPPGQFIPIADASGLIVPLGEHVMLKACRQAAMWRQSGRHAARIAINVSAQQFRHPSFLKSLRAALSSTGLDPKLLELEIVENALIGNEPVVDAVFEALGTLGVELAIDDFGTGYSSLSYLKRLPIDTVKIDRSFVRDVPGSPEACAIVHAVVAMAHGLGLQVVAEGIEAPAQLDFLKQAGCDRGQGYYFGRPEPAEHWALYGGNVLPLKRPDSAAPSSRA